jgi:hypothetical protein
MTKRPGALPPCAGSFRVVQPLLKVWSTVLVVFAVALTAWLGALAVAIRFP